jgi:hypothetical protein
VPFYFDGNYPGGGARFLCEAIPFCQILVARAAFDLRVTWLPPLAAVAGFALYARHGHEELRDREGARPMFEPAVVANANVTRGLLFVDTDHGFNLGHDPRALGPGRGLLVARARDDAHDRELYERLGRPLSYRYVFDFDGRAAPRVVPYVPLPTGRIEAEAEWPALGLRGSAYPRRVPCASGGRALRLLPGTSIALAAGSVAGPDGLVVGWLGTTSAGSRVRARVDQNPWIEHSATGPGCSTWRIPGPSFSSEAQLEVQLLSGEGALDFVDGGPQRASR